MCAGGQSPLQDFGKNISKTFQSPLITIFQIFGPSYGSVLMCLWAAKLVRQTKAQLRCPIFTQNQAKNYKNIRYSGKLCSVILSHFFSTKQVFSVISKIYQTGPYASIDRLLTEYPQPKFKFAH